MNSSLKKSIVASAILMSTFILKAQIGGVLSQGSPWTGTYTGDVSGTNSLLTFEGPVSQLNATIDAAGYIYHLSGEVDDNSWHGKLEDRGRGGVMDFRATSENGTIHIVLLVPDQFGGVNEWPLQFKRPGMSQPAQPQPPAQSQQSKGSSSGNHDPYLVGGWRYTESYTSGEFGMVSEWYMNIYEDGTYTYGDGKVAGGGAAGSFNSGGSSGHETGKWKTEGNIVYINEGFGWQPYARYYVEGNSLMFTFGDGSKQVWKRYR